MIIIRIIIMIYIYIYIYIIHIYNIIIINIGHIRPKWPFDPKAAAPSHASSTGGNPKDQSVIKKLLNELKLHSEI